MQLLILKTMPCLRFRRRCCLPALRQMQQFVCGTSVKRRKKATALLCRQANYLLGSLWATRKGLIELFFTQWVRKKELIKLFSTQRVCVYIYSLPLHLIGLLVWVFFAVGFLVMLLCRSCRPAVYALTRRAVGKAYQSLLKHVLSCSQAGA